MSAYTDYLDARSQRHRRDMLSRVVAPIAGVAAAGLAPVIGGAFSASGAPVSSAAGGAAGGVTRAAGAGIPWLRLAELGSGIGLNLWGGSRAAAADRRAQETEQAYMARQMAMLEDNERQRRLEWQAQQDLQRQAFDADQEQVRLDRADRDYDRKQDRYRFERREPNARASYGGLVNLAQVYGVNPGPYRPLAMPPGYGERG